MNFMLALLPILVILFLMVGLRWSASSRRRSWLSMRAGDRHSILRRHPTSYSPMRMLKDCSFH